MKLAVNFADEAGRGAGFDHLGDAFPAHVAIDFDVDGELLTFEEVAPITEGAIRILR
jgi:hypothetical protein